MTRWKKQTGIDEILVGVLRLIIIQQMCSGRQFRGEGAYTEKFRDEKLLLMPYDLARRFVIEEC